LEDVRSSLAEMFLAGLGMIPGGAAMPSRSVRPGARPRVPQSPIVVRKSGAGEDAVGTLSRPNHVYRGMTQAEFDATVGAGRGVQSRRDYSHSSEGTSFGADAQTAESYVNFGHTDPRKTGTPTYLVEVRASNRLAVDRRDGYPKAAGEIPREDIARVWKMLGNGDAVEAVEIPLAKPGLR
jgi:hypothetical protein